MKDALMLLATISDDKKLLFLKNLWSRSDPNNKYNLMEIETRDFLASKIASEFKVKELVTDPSCQDFIEKRA